MAWTFFYFILYSRIINRLMLILFLLPQNFDECRSNPYDALIYNTFDTKYRIKKIQKTYYNFTSYFYVK